MRRECDTLSRAAELESWFGRGIARGDLSRTLARFNGTLIKVRKVDGDDARSRPTELLYRTIDPRDDRYILVSRETRVTSVR